MISSIMKGKVAEGPFQLRSFKFHLATPYSWVKRGILDFVGEFASVVNSKKCKVYRKVLRPFAIKSVGVYVR